MKYPEVKFNRSWVQEPMTEGLAEWCESFAKYLAPADRTDRQALTTSQLRKFFAEVRLIENNLEKKDCTSDILMLKPYLAYAVGREKKPTKLRDFQKEISTAIDGIRKDTIHIASDYRNFISIYEAIVAYHKFYGGKDN
ncbi:MAG: type III-A CRISPR-associated protein Csm2 [Paludibacteraceae bacterium]|nr:type III-A CRISPR-associated protein Csm2 [Paludibacteraceae bacterium]